MFSRLCVRHWLCLAGAIVAALLVVLLVVRGAGADGRGISWVLPADDVDLMKVWKHAVAELEVDPSRAALTNFDAWWRADGSLRSLNAQTVSADGTLMFITTARPPDSGTITINACAYPVDVTPTSILPEGSFVPPPAYDLIDSLSSVGIERLAQETSTIREEGEGLMLILDKSAVDPNETVLELSERMGNSNTRIVEDGITARAVEAMSLSELSPAQLFMLWRARVGWESSRGVEKTGVYLIVK